MQGPSNALLQPNIPILEDAAHAIPLALVQLRRQAQVRAALLAKGIDAARLRAQGFGPDRPLADNASEAGRAKNRRVELVKL